MSILDFFNNTPMVLIRIIASTLLSIHIVDQYILNSISKIALDLKLSASIIAFILAFMNRLPNAIWNYKDAGDVDISSQSIIGTIVHTLLIGLPIIVFLSKKRKYIPYMHLHMNIGHFLISLSIFYLSLIINTNTFIVCILLFVAGFAHFMMILRFKNHPLDRPECYIIQKQKKDNNDVLGDPINEHLIKINNEIHIDINENIIEMDRQNTKKGIYFQTNKNNMSKNELNEKNQNFHEEEETKRTLSNDNVIKKCSKEKDLNILYKKNKNNVIFDLDKRKANEHYKGETIKVENSKPFKQIFVKKVKSLDQDSCVDQADMNVLNECNEQTYEKNDMNVTNGIIRGFSAETVPCKKNSPLNENKVNFKNNINETLWCDPNEDPDKKEDFEDIEKRIVEKCSHNLETEQNVTERNISEGFIQRHEFNHLSATSRKIKKIMDILNSLLKTTCSYFLYERLENKKTFKAIILPFIVTTSINFGLFLCILTGNSMSIDEFYTPFILIGVGCLIIGFLMIIDKKRSAFDLFIFIHAFTLLSIFTNQFLNLSGILNHHFKIVLWLDEIFIRGLLLSIRDIIVLSIASYNRMFKTAVVSVMISGILNITMVFGSYLCKMLYSGIHYNTAVACRYYLKTSIAVIFVSLVSICIHYEARNRKIERESGYVLLFLYAFSILLMWAEAKYRLG